VAARSDAGLFVEKPPLAKNHDGAAGVIPGLAITIKPCNATGLPGFSYFKEKIK